MISREEALKVYFSSVSELSKEERVRQAYDAIKYSIGSCGECIHQDDGTGDCYRMWSISCSTIPFNDWYCADFERKE